MEIGVSSARIIAYDKKKNEEYMNTSLDLLQDKGDDSQVKLAAYQKRIERYFNSNVYKKKLQSEGISPKGSIYHKQRNELQLTWLEMRRTIYYIRICRNKSIKVHKERW